MSNSSQNLMIGRLPPSCIEFEEAVLGAIMSFSDAIYEVADILRPEMFYKDQNKYIYSAIIELFEENQSIDLLTVSMQLKKNKKLNESGGDLYLIQLTQKTSSSAHLEYHSRLIIQSFVKRQSINVSSKIIEQSYSDDTDIFKLLENIYSDFDKVQQSVIVGKISNFKESVLNFLKTNENKKNEIKTFLRHLNLVLGGWYQSDLIILAARPGMGKTAFILNDIVSIARTGTPVAFFSLEMSMQQIIGRLISIISGLSSYKLRDVSKLNENEKKLLDDSIKELSELPIIIDDTPGISPVRLKLQLSKFKREKGVKISYIDYLQLMRIENIFNREQEISKISSSLKATAKDLDIPIIALSQLSRAVESRGSSKRPMLSDLRDSGSIEQDADIVLFIYRPEYYKIEQWDDEDGLSTRNTAEVTIAKHRNGKLDAIRVGCDLSKMRFSNLDSDDVEYENVILPDNKEELPF